MNIFEKGLLKYLNTNQLTTIQSQKIAIGGAGGLGSNIAMILVRSGFKHFEILDQDIIDASNLNRQQYFSNEIGQDKVSVLKRRLLQINQDLNITIHKTTWNTHNAKHYFKNCDYYVEAFDHVGSKLTFVEFYQPFQKPIIAGSGMAGLKIKETIRVKNIGNLYIVGDQTTDTAQGHPPMAPRVTICSAMMAEVILNISLNI